MVPQGSVLSVTLFLLTINDITKSVPNGISCSLYADDFAIYLASSYMPAAERQLQIAINRVYKQANEHGFTLTVEAAMQFHRRRHLHYQPFFTINNNRIRYVESHKFLGQLFDSCLKWIEHIKYLRTSCTKAVSILKVLSHNNWGADRVSLLRLYKALIRSKLDYGCQLYGSASKQELGKLEPIHNEGI